MVFSSAAFIFVFLPIVITLYLLVRKELRNYVLLIASILFYAWGEPKYLAIMFLTILINFYGAILIDKYEKHKKLILISAIILNLSFLFYFKYFNFVIENINLLFRTNLDFIKVIMPIGISFYTFQALSYLVDVYRKEVKVQKDIYKLALYICLFPQLIAGPIVKYHDVSDQIENRTEDFDKVAYGVKRFIIGLAKKVIIANTMGAIVDNIFAIPVSDLSTSACWLGAIAYTFQIFYDFSGYSDMAIGLGSIFGFKFLENFNYPYISKSITEFWRRWHISLSTWFKEYVYISLGGNRVSKNRTLLNLFIVFLLTGIWHGAAWVFIVWGLWHGAFILFERITNWHKVEGGLKISIIQHIYTILAFVIGWIFFRADDLIYALKYILKMFFILPNKEPLLHAAPILYRGNAVILVIALILSLPLFKNILNIDKKHKVLNCLVNVWLVFLLVVSSFKLLSLTYNPFIYFRF